MINFALKNNVDSKYDSFSGSCTESNLWICFITESMTRNRFIHYASVTKRAGYGDMASMLLITADNKKERSKFWYKLLRKYNSVRKDIDESVYEEHYEWDDMYSKMETIAREEGFDEIADAFKHTAKLERFYEERFKDLLVILSDGNMFSCNNFAMWQCKVCGHIYFATSLPVICSLCR